MAYKFRPEYFCGVGNRRKRLAFEEGKKPSCDHADLPYPKNEHLLNEGGFHRRQAALKLFFHERHNAGSRFATYFVVGERRPDKFSSFSLARIRFKLLLRARWSSLSIDFPRIYFAKSFTAMILL